MNCVCFFLSRFSYQDTARKTQTYIMLGQLLSWHRSHLTPKNANIDYNNKEQTTIGMHFAYLVVKATAPVTRKMSQMR